MKLSSPASFTMNDELRSTVQAYLNRGGFESVSEGLRALIIRGLYLEEKPRGRWSESAWMAAYHSFRGIIFDTFHRKLLGAEFKGLLEAAFAEAMRRSGSNVL